DLPPSAERAPLAAAAPEHRRPGPGAAAVGAREGFLPLDLREGRKGAVPRIDPPDRHRQAAAPGLRALLRRREEHHVQEVRDARDPRLRAEPALGAETTRLMPVVDVHTHLLPPELPRWKERFGYGGFIQLEPLGPCRARMLKDDGQTFREVEENLWSPPARIAECDRAGVDVQVLSTVRVMFSYWAKPEDGAEVARFLNDHLASVVAGAPQRFVGLGTLPMQAPALAVRELERCVKTLGLSGVQIGSHVNDWNLSDPALFEVSAAAAELGAAVFVHPWDMMGEARMRRYWLPWLVGMPAEVSLAICSVIFGGILERLPALRLGFAPRGRGLSRAAGRTPPR